MQASPYPRLERRLTQLAEVPHALKGGLIGLEKESLRLGPDGVISQTPHPRPLGAALTHAHITTDYSEALLELVTAPHPQAGDTLDFLHRLHRFVYRQLGEELIWAASMPCVVDGEASIPIARYGSSNLGMMKHIYRRGLGYRYGKVMQVIAGIHFNYSLPQAFWPLYRELENSRQSLREFIDERYFALIRNAQRFGWLLLYLFGSSPAVCKSFLGAQPNALAEYDENTYYLPHATSLRMSDIGYSNQKRVHFSVSYDAMQAYVADLERAIATPHPPYQDIGVVVDGEYRQLSANLLQIANEYYSSIRPKQPLNGNEAPTLALRRRGVGYVELRTLDVNPFHPLGVELADLRFLEAFLLFCSLCDSPPISAAEQREIEHNQRLVAQRGRQPGLRLLRHGTTLTLADWAAELCQALGGVAEQLEDAQGSYRRVLDTQQQAARDPQATPSARVLEDMSHHGEGFFHFAKRWSLRHREHFKAAPLEQATERDLARQAARSHRRQRAIEAADDQPFAAYLAAYFSQNPATP